MNIPIDQAKRNARQRLARIEAGATQSVEPRDDNRQPGRLLLQVNGVTIDLTLQPDAHDVRRWIAWRDGAPWMRCGLERLWRALQAEIAPPLGRRHWQ